MSKSGKNANKHDTIMMLVYRICNNIGTSLSRNAPATTVSARSSDISSDNEEHEETEDEPGPLNLSKRDQATSRNTMHHYPDQELHSDSESSQEEEAPLNLCLRLQTNNQALIDTTDSKTAEKEPILNYEASPAREQDLDPCDQRHSAAFALCQLASSRDVISKSPIGQEEMTHGQNINHLLSPNKHAAKDTSDTLKQGTRAPGQKRAKSKPLRHNAKRARVKEPARTQRKRSQNC